MAKHINHTTILVIAKVICLLSIAFAVLWGAHAVDRFLATLGGQVVSVGTLAGSIGKATESIGKTADMLALLESDLQQQELGKHTKNAIISWHGISFDLRKNWTANEKFLELMQTQMAGALDKTGSSMDRVAASIEALRCDIGPPTTSLLTDAATAVRGAQADLHAVSKSVEHGTAGVATACTRFTDQATATLQGTDPIIEDAARISESAARLAEYYERKWTHGSKWEKAKMIIMTIFAVVNRTLYPG